MTNIDYLKISYEKIGTWLKGGHFRKRFSSGKIFFQNLLKLILHIPLTNIKKHCDDLQEDNDRTFEVTSVLIG